MAVPVVGVTESDERAQGGRLAGSVGTEEADDLALVDVEAQVVDGPHGAEVLGEVLNRDDGHVHAHHPERAHPPRACWPVSRGERRGTLPRTDDMRITVTGGQRPDRRQARRAPARPRRRRHHALAPPRAPPAPSPGSPSRSPRPRRRSPAATRSSTWPARTSPSAGATTPSAASASRASSAPATWSPASRPPTRARACSSSSSAVGYYGPHGDERLDEDTPRRPTTSSPRCA